MNILFIKHGSLGDIVISFGALKSIRKHFKKDQIFLLTQENYKKMFLDLPFVNEILVDNRKNIFSSLLNYFFIIRKKKIDLVIDLQNSSRTNFYHLFTKIFTNVKISSSRYFAHYRYISKAKGNHHISKNHIDQLKILGVKNFYKPDLSWMKSRNNSSKNYVIIIPGCSKSGQHKRWPAHNFAKLSSYLIKKKFEVFLTGSNLDKEIINEIIDLCPGAKNKIEDSEIKNFYSLCKFAKLIISIDTGPGHIAGLTNQPMIWIANDNNVSKSGYPLGDSVYKILSKDIKTITSDDVEKVIKKVIYI